jgi:monoamine oxidase
MEGKKLRVAVIGGGPGGLMVSYLLQKRADFAFEATIYEATGRLGGKIVTARAGCDSRIAFELGAAEFYDYSQLGPDPLRELIAELGLSVAPMRAGGAVFRERIVRDLEDVRREFGRETWRALRDFTKRARSEISPADYYESDWRKDNDDPLARKRFRQYLDRVSDPVARDFIQAMTHSDVACEPHQTSASYGLQNYLMDEPDYMQLYSIVGGNELLTRRLASRISSRVLLEHPVVRVEQDDAEENSGKYRVVSRNGGARHSELYDFVVVALPNDCIPSIEWGGSALSEAMRKHHEFYDHPAHYLRVTAVFDRPFWREAMQGEFFMIDAFGGCCLYDESARFESAGLGVLGWLIAGDAALRLGNLDDDVLVQRAVDELPKALRAGQSRLIEAHVKRWAKCVNGLPGGFPAREPDSRHCPDREAHPNVFAVGDYLFDSTLNGVLDSADTVVEWIRELVAAPNNNAEEIPSSPREVEVGVTVGISE